MKFASSLTTSLLAFTTAIGHVAAKQLQSDPFHLVVISDNEKINGSMIEACHEGAAIEGLCKGAKAVKKSEQDYYTYTFKYDKSTPNDGNLIWKLPSGGKEYPEPMGFFYYYNTNVALPQFGYNDPLTVSFDKHNRMFVKGYLDDTVTPPTSGTQTKLYNWYMCTQNYNGYVYQSLGWLLGQVGVTEPQNPSCVKVDVVRQFC